MSEPMKQVILQIGDLYWMQNINWGTFRALQRRGLVHRQRGDDARLIGLSQEGDAAYWEILAEMSGRNEQ